MKRLSIALLMLSAAPLGAQDAARRPVAKAAEEPIHPIWFVAAPAAVLGLGVAWLALRSSDERTRNRSRGVNRRYRFTVSAQQQQHQDSQPRPPSQAQMRANRMASTAGMDTGTPVPQASRPAGPASETVSEAMREARAVLGSAPAATLPTEPPPIPKAAATGGTPLKSPKNASARPRSQDTRITLAPEGLWIAQNTARPGSRIRVRWATASGIRETEIIFAPGANTSGHYLYTQSRPLAAEIASILPAR